MSTVENIPLEQRFLLHGVSWRIYQDLRDAPENEHVRMTYQGGDLEMMAPSKSHEQYASLIDRLLHVWTLERGIDIQSCRTMTCKREDLRRGFEPDNCYYVANEALVRNHPELDLTVDPPPDLAVEVDLSGKGRDKLAVYAAFGVPEVWWFDGRRLQVSFSNTKPRPSTAPRKNNTRSGNPVSVFPACRFQKLNEFWQYWARTARPSWSGRSAIGCGHIYKSTLLIASPPRRLRFPCRRRSV